jgi:hypothetical protein
MSRNNVDELATMEVEAIRRLTSGDLFNIARRQLCRPWRQLKSIPRDERQVLLAWVDCDGTWNIAIGHWCKSNRWPIGDAGQLYHCVVGWMPRPKLPGAPRTP